MLSDTAEEVSDINLLIGFLPRALNFMSCLQMRESINAQR